MLWFHLLLIVLILLPSYATWGYYAVMVVARWCGCCERLEPSATPRSRLLILIPAHNEAAGIGTTVQSCLQLDYPAERRRIVVLADNCTDDTSERALSAGVECLIRDAPHQPGKGQALAWAFEQLAAAEVDAILVLDADCQLERQALRIVDAFLSRGEQVLQLNHRVLNPDASPISYAAGVGRTLEYDLFFAPKSRLRLAVLLVGTGMVFHRDVLQRHPWSAMSCAEDTEQTFRLAEAHQRVCFVENAHVGWTCVETWNELRVQRARWASGNLRLGRQQAWSMIARGLRQRNGLLTDLGWTLCIQSRPLVLAHLAAGQGIGWIGGRLWPHPITTALLASLWLLIPLYLAYFLAGVITLGINRRRIRLLLRAPRVVGELIWISLCGLLRPNVSSWVRTPRP